MTRDFVGSCLLCINGASHVEEVVWPLFHVVIHVFCTSVRIPLLALPWSDPVAFSFPCCFCGWSLCLSLLRLLCFWSPRGRAGLPLPPDCFCVWSCRFFWVCLVLSCGCPPLCPPSPWRLVVLISVSEDYLVASATVWASGRSA